jgi:hypothetical protein
MGLWALLTGAALRFLAGGGLAVLAGTALFPPALVGIEQRPVPSIAVGLLAAGILALVRMELSAAALALAVAAAVLELGLSVDHGWPRVVLEPVWLLLVGGGLFLAAVVYDGMARSRYRFGKFLVLGTLFAGIYVAMTPLALIVQPLARPVGGELMLNAFLGMLVGDAVGLGVEILELLGRGRLP